MLLHRPTGEGGCPAAVIAILPVELPSMISSRAARHLTRMSATRPRRGMTPSPGW
ncbi:hypothetical protein PVAP13_2KG257858 [Panicum virgatum]|uniref:Uncharacterized protein n=1 Tax=Panicum virgatum TaxID=38727 RepID=A0A8T0W3Z6_PANVG|nr:hypothetical protein PVAP13_2KG257858 [Panicum virgatum]